MPISKDWGRYATAQEFEPGQYVFREGDPGSEMYIIERGQIAITKETGGDEPLVLGYRTEGELLGEISLINAAPRSASALVVQPSRLLAIGRDDFWRLMREEDGFQQMVMQTLISSLLDADRSLVSAADSERDLYERFASLSTEHERMAELMQLRRETINFIVHDLRNPLNLVSMALSLIKIAPGFDAGGQMGRFVAMAGGGVQRMLALVDALLDVERLEGGEVALDLESVRMPELLGEIIERVEPLAWGSNIQIELAPPPADLPPALIDRHRIDRVVTNLIDNAIKFTPNGGQITLSVGREGDMLVVAVNDTGPGIPPDQRGHIFERFAQTEEGRKAKGFGLGLAYCRSAVMAHGGRIWVEEGDNGVGSRFVFTLPISA